MQNNSSFVPLDLNRVIIESKNFWRTLYLDNLQHPSGSGRLDGAVVKCLKLKFGQYFPADILLRFCRWRLVEILKICVGATEASGQCLTLNVKFMLFNGLKGTIYQGLNDWKCWYCEDSIPWNIRKYIAQPKLERFLLNWIAALKKENPKSILKNYTSPKTNLWNLFHISWVNILTKL